MHNGNGSKHLESMKERRIRLERTYTSGNRFIMNTDFLSFLSGDLAIVLSYLITVAHLNRSEERNGGWFYCKMIRFKRVLHMPRWKQTRLVAGLKALNLLKTEMRGLPAKRYFWVDYDVVDREVAEGLRKSRED